VAFAAAATAVHGSAAQQQCQQLKQQLSHERRMDMLHAANSATSLSQEPASNTAATSMC
jgi:hypothetical protein